MKVYRPTLAPLVGFLSWAIPLALGLLQLARGDLGAAASAEVFVGLPVGIFLWRLSVVRLEVDDGGITSHGPLKTRHLPWSETASS